LAHEHEHKEEDYDKLIRVVGGFSYQALMHAKSLVKVDAKLIDVANDVEKYVRDKGFGCAFPINLSINEQAAHYSPSCDDSRVFTDKDLVKIDFGVSKDGVLGDCAVTVDLSGKHQKLVEASAEALANAIKKVKAGVKVFEIGAEIQKTIESKGFLPVKNLGGHGVALHDLHSEPFIPNYDNDDETELEDGMVIAIEPFATDGKTGLIKESDICEIYELAGDAQLRSVDARTAIQIIAEYFESEPFAKRQMVRYLLASFKNGSLTPPISDLKSAIVPSISEYLENNFRISIAMRALLEGGAIVAHPVLVDVDGGMVSQAEAQVLVTKDGCEILTK
jgi:methionyl aminopeptidase